MTPRILNEAPRPGTPEWRKIITGSKIPTILGLNPYQTQYELWMEMSGLAKPEKLEGDHLDWGHVAENSLAEWWLHKNPGWQLNAGEIAYTDDDLPFPNLVTLDRRARRGRGFHIVECKTSDVANLWAKQEDLPAHVHAQVIGQQGISGIHRASVVAQLGSTVPKIFEVEWEPELWEGMIPVLQGFYDSLGEAEPPVPPLDLLEAIEKATVTPPTETTVEAPEELVGEYLELQRQKQFLDDEIKHCESLLSDTDAKKITHAGKSLASWQDGRFAASRVPAEFKHLLKDPEVTVQKFDPKKFAEKYPEIAERAIGEGTYRFTPKPFLKETA